MSHLRPPQLPSLALCCPPVLVDAKFQNLPVFGSRFVHRRTWLGRLCRSLDLGQGLALLESSLLLQAEDLESVKVGKLGALALLLLSLGPVGLLPLLVDLGLLPELLDDGGPHAAGQVGQNEVGQDDLGERNGLAGNSQGSV